MYMRGMGATGLKAVVRSERLGEFRAEDSIEK